MTARVQRFGYGCRIGMAILASVVLGAACAPDPSEPPSPSALGDNAITVGSFDFPESVLLANVYGEALRSNGYKVRYLLGRGPRELLDPSLARGLVELVPEYSGTALEFLSLGEAHPTAEVAATHEKLERVLRDTPVMALDPAPAQDANAVVVTRATAARLALRRISDLAGVAPRLTFGGPPECPSRPFCLQGLERKYRLEFENFLPLDAGGPLTRQALEQSQIDVGLMFTTDPQLSKGELVALPDDLALQPAENVTPLIHRHVVQRFGPDVVKVLNEVSSRLTTDALRSMNGEVEKGASPAEAANAWLSAEGLQ